MRSVRRPALVAFLLYLGGACIVYTRRVRGARFDIVQATDCSFPSADVCYAHFCHRAYLTEVWPRLRIRRSPRSLHSWMTHKAKSLIEARLVRRARVIVVPAGDSRAISTGIYPGVREKIVVIRNTVDLATVRAAAGL